MFDKLKEQLLGINDAITQYEKRIIEYEAKIKEQESAINTLNSALMLSNDMNKEYQKKLDEERREHEAIVAALNERIAELEKQISIGFVASSEDKSKDEVSDLLTDKGFYLSKEQANAYEQINSILDASNYFITGKAGTGKSAVLDYFRTHTDKRVAVVAPTGIAAINVKGQTIHSFFGMRATIQDVSNREDVRKIKTEKLNVLRSIDTLIIDEISMVRADIMDMIDAKLKIARGNNEPFGGCQIIAFGDLYQLPPVVTDDEHVINFLKDRYETEFFFSAPVVQDHPFKRIELEHVHRQNDPLFINTLNNIRLGENIEESIDVINSRCIDIDTDKNFITITPTKSAAEMINSSKLNMLEGREYTYYGDIEGEFKPDEVPTDIELTLKEGAQVMMIKNDQAKRWVNGTIATISKLNRNDICVKINGMEYHVEPEEWSKINYKYDTETKELEQEIVGRFTQYPLKLAYAITIHKSQGQTFDEVCIDYSGGGAFAAGQTYVAISRCRSLEGLYLTTPISASDIKVDDKILGYMDQKTEDTTEVPELIQALQESDAFAKIEEDKDDHIVRIGEPNRPRKITGSNFGALFAPDKYNDEFSAWCNTTKAYKKPFTENQCTAAGNAIEPIQIKYIKNSFRENIVTPEEHFGPDPKHAMNFDFFPHNKVFGGMWDAVKKNGKNIVGVYEMKTAKAYKKKDWEQEVPKNYLLQVALYAQLLHVDDMTIVASFLEEEDYEEPENYRCNEDNTMIIRMKLSEVFPNFSKDYMEPAQKWWEKHVKTGISPKWSEKDRAIAEDIKARYSQYN